MKCEEVSKLVSQSLDRRLPLHQRIGIRLHLMVCKLCAQNFHQLLDLRRTLNLFMKENDKIEPPEILSPEKKAEIKKEIRRISDRQ
jgi:predicted anti-sigma-YlaC factor YlaD